MARVEDVETVLIERKFCKREKILSHMKSYVVIILN